jgi:hypothetical protein
MKAISIGTTIDEIKRVSEFFGLDFNLIKAAVKIESDFDAERRVGSCTGLFQLSDQ